VVITEQSVAEDLGTRGQAGFDDVHRSGLKNTDRVLRMMEKKSTTAWSWHRVSRVKRAVYAASSSASHGQMVDCSSSCTFTDRRGVAGDGQSADRPDRAVTIGVLGMRPWYTPLAAPRFHIPWHRLSATATPVSFPFCAAALRNAWVLSALRLMPAPPAAFRKLSR